MVDPDPDEPPEGPLKSSEVRNCRTLVPASARSEPPERAIAAEFSGWVMIA